MCRPSNQVPTSCYFGNCATILNTVRHGLLTASRPLAISYRAGLTANPSTTTCPTSTPTRGHSTTLCHFPKHLS